LFQIPKDRAGKNQSMCAEWPSYKVKNNSDQSEALPDLALVCIFFCYNLRKRTAKVPVDYFAPYA